MKHTRASRILSIVLSLLIVVGITTISREIVLAATDATGLNYNIADGVATITGFAAPEGFSGTLTIPATLGGASVTSIGDKTFYHCSSLTSITIPSSVTSIGKSAFSWCSSLTSITVDAVNTAYKSEDGILFKKNGTVLVCCPGGKSGSITVPSGVTSIDHSAFQNCSSLTDITISSTVTSIGDCAFDYCSSLTSFIVDAANTTYKSIDGVLYSKDSAMLFNCPEGKSGSITIPSSVTCILPGFGSCSTLTAITVDAFNTEYKSMDGILYSKDGTVIISCPGGKSGSITIPSGVTSIEVSAFYACYNLTGIAIPSSVTSIGSQAFWGCTSLASITIPSGVTSIERNMFINCSSLTSVTIPSSVTSIGEYAFFGCSSLANITIPSGVTSIGDSMFFNCSSLTSVVIPSGVTSIGEYVFFGCTRLASITIPSGVTNIGDFVFGKCSSLSDAYFLGSAPALGLNIFRDCASDFTVHYLSTSTGYTNPWHEYPAASFAGGITYQTHVQDIGWQDYVRDGAASGTSAQSKRLEGIRIKLELEGISGGIEYRTQVQDIGWMDWTADDALSGTSGQSKRLEAIQIRLTEEAANVYDVYYRVHAQNMGWMDWAKNGVSAGTAGHSYRLEAIEIKLVPKGDPAPGATTRPYVDLAALKVSYKTHVQDIGWQAYISNGDVSGTSGQSKRLEAIQMKLENIAGGIEYRTHVQDYGWMDWVADDASSGTSGQSKRLEAIQIRLTGAAAEVYDIYYCVHAQNTGWLDWAKNGESAGTAGLSYRLEAIKVVLVPKGGAAPGAATRPFVQG